jgi:hypothetical protein
MQITWQSNREENRWLTQVVWRWLNENYYQLQAGLQVMARQFALDSGIKPLLNK